MDFFASYLEKYTHIFHIALKFASKKNEIYACPRIQIANIATVFKFSRPYFHWGYNDK